MVFENQRFPILNVKTHEANIWSAFVTSSNLLLALGHQNCDFSSFSENTFYSGFKYYALIQIQHDRKCIETLWRLRIWWDPFMNLMERDVSSIIYISACSWSLYTVIILGQTLIGYRPSTKKWLNCEKLSLLNLHYYSRCRYDFLIMKKNVMT